jgi:hypothetical protein
MRRMVNVMSITTPHRCLPGLAREGWGAMMGT